MFIFYPYINVEAIHLKAVLVEAINKHCSENASFKIWRQKEYVLGLNRLYMSSY
jgi:hypothetical protein